METTIESKADEDANARALLDGAVAKEIGLTEADLRIGLTVAKAHMERGALAEALKVYAMLILCLPKTVDFQIGYANCALAMEENELAVQAAEVAITLAPSDPRGFYMSGMACLALGWHEEARSDLLQAVELGKQVRAAAIVDGARRLLQALPDGAEPSRAAS